MTFARLDPERQTEYAAELEAFWREHNEATGKRTLVHADYLEVSRPARSGNEHAAEAGERDAEESERCRFRHSRSRDNRRLPKREPVESARIRIRQIIRNVNRKREYSGREPRQSRAAPLKRLHFVDRQCECVGSRCRIVFERIELERICELRQNKVCSRTKSQLEKEACPNGRCVIQKRLCEAVLGCAARIREHKLGFQYSRRVEEYVVRNRFGLAPVTSSLLGAGVFPTGPMLPVEKPGVENVLTDPIVAAPARENAADVSIAANTSMMLVCLNFM